LSAVFSIIGAIFDAIMTILGAIARVIAAIIEAAPAVFGWIMAVAGVTATVLQGIGKGLEAIPQVVEGIEQVVPAQMTSYVVWYVIEASVIAFFPAYTLVIAFAFILFTIYGLLQLVGAIGGSRTAIGAILAITALAVNVYLVLVIG
jgi:hypothetical protein